MGQREYRYYIILKLIDNGSYPAQIARKLNTTRQNIYKILKNMEKKKWIVVVTRKPKTFKLTPTGYHVLQNLEKKLAKKKKTDVNHSSYRVSEQVRDVRVHALRLKFPIVFDGSGGGFGRPVFLNNWIKRVARLDFPVAVTVSKTTRSVVVDFHARVFKRGPSFFTDLLEWVLKGIWYVYWFLAENNVKIDPRGVRVLHQHIANPMPEFDGVVPENLSVEVKLGRRARGPGGYLREEAKVWGDRSGGLFEVETNDLTYEEKLVLMPENVDEVKRRTMRIQAKLYDIDDSVKKFFAALDKFSYSLEMYNENIMMHLDVLRKMSETLDDIKNYIKRGK